MTPDQFIHSRQRAEKRHMLKGAIILASSFVLISYGVFTMSVSMVRYQCATRWGHSGLDTQYSFFAGCLVEKDGHFIPEENIRFFP